MSTEIEKMAGMTADSLIDNLEKIASEAGFEFTREEISQIVTEDLEKVANIWQSPAAKKAMGISSDVALRGGTSLLMGAGALAMARGLHNMGNVGRRKSFERALDEVKRSNPIVREADADKVERFANTIFRFAPNASSDPNLLASVLSQAVQYESMDQQTIKSLVELESRMQQMAAFKPSDAILKG